MIHKNVKIILLYDSVHSPLFFYYWRAWSRSYNEEGLHVDEVPRWQFYLNCSFKKYCILLLDKITIIIIENQT